MKLEKIVSSPQERLKLTEYAEENHRKIKVEIFGPQGASQGSLVIGLNVLAEMLETLLPGEAAFQLEKKKE